MSIILIFHFISDEKLRKEYIAQTLTEQKVRERPLCYIAPSFEDETDRLAEIVKISLGPRSRTSADSFCRNCPCNTMGVPEHR